jgi:hypothetical protein
MGINQSKKSRPTVHRRTVTIDEHNNITKPRSKMLSSLSADKEGGYTFVVPKDSWNNECPIHSLGLSFAPVEETRCLLRSNNTTVAVLLLNEDMIHVCSFTPPGDKHEGQPLFEWAIIGKHKGGSPRRNNGYTMKTPFDGAFATHTILTESAKSGSFSSSPSSSLSSTSRSNIEASRRKDGTINCASKIIVKINNQKCASFEECEASWHCNVARGVDPALMVCFVAALDRLKTLNQGRRRVARRCSTSPRVLPVTRFFDSVKGEHHHESKRRVGHKDFPSLRVLTPPSDFRIPAPTSAKCPSP